MNKLLSRCTLGYLWRHCCNCQQNGVKCNLMGEGARPRHYDVNVANKVLSTDAQLVKATVLIL